MTPISKKQLKRLNDKEFKDDIKKFIKRNHEFYSTKVPELKILAKRLNEEYKLKGFYKVFNKFWNSGYNNERSLAIQTLEMYKEEFNIETWKFFKQKLKQIKSWDKVDSVSVNIIGEILLRTDIQEEIIKMARSNDRWYKRMALMSTIPLIRENKINLALELCEICLNNRDEKIQSAVGKVLNEIALKKPEISKKFILKNQKMSELTFFVATENLPELRKLRKTKNNSIDLSKLFFWRD